mmetsp:Transcript_101564/g.310586  ORF Transcript_101564/g.310586 Transcript_101564/m.310586 type:complete len:224 (+) Transcript_101564:204-875(+)
MRCWVGALKYGLRHEQIERAPTQTPRVHLGRRILPPRIQLGRAEVLADESFERHRRLGARHQIGAERHSLARVANTHVPLAVVEDVQQHVFQRDVLHGEGAAVQARDAPGRLADEALRLALLEPAGAEPKGLEEVAAGGELRHQVVVPVVGKVVLQLGDMVQPAHDLHEPHLAEGRLAELVVVVRRAQAFEALDHVPLQHLHRKPEPRREARGFPDVAKDGLL